MNQTEESRRLGMKRRTARTAPRCGSAVGRHDKDLTPGERRCLWRVAAFCRMLADFRAVPPADILAFCRGRLTLEKTMRSLIRRGLVREIRRVPWVQLTSSGARVVSRFAARGKKAG